MTREEIDRAGAHILATSVHELTWADGFETGVKFTEEKTAERTKKEIIKKACEWLDNELYEVMTEPNPYYISEVQSKSYNSLEVLINDFKKAMES